MDDEHEQHIGTTDARAGATPHMTRYILALGLVLVIVVVRRPVASLAVSPILAIEAAAPAGAAAAR